MREAQRFGMALGLVLALAGPAWGAQTRHWTFSDVERIELEGVSGDVELVPADGSEWVLTLWDDVTPSDAFEAEVWMDGLVMGVRERWRGGESSGRVMWTVSVPTSGHPLVRVHTSSGDLNIEGVEARLAFRSSSGSVTLREATVVSGSSFETSSGDYRLHDVVAGNNVSLETSSGDFEFVRVTTGKDFRARTSSGDVTVESSQGVPWVESSSGDVRVLDIELTEASRFFSSSGDVVVRLSAPTSQDLEVGSSSGEVRLDPRTLGDDFRLVLTKREDRGRIDVPFAYSSEEVFLRNGQVYVEKVVERGTGRPVIRLQTASGLISVRE